jgi:hypothetical protein
MYVDEAPFSFFKLFSDPFLLLSLGLAFAASKVTSSSSKKVFTQFLKRRSKCIFPFSEREILYNRIALTP